MQWYFIINDEQQGPVDKATAKQMAETHPDAYFWHDGLPKWLPVSYIHEYFEADSTLPPPFNVDHDNNDESQHSESISRKSNNIKLNKEDLNYTIHGDMMPYVELTLEPEKSIIAEAGTMIYKDADIIMDTVLGDGSQEDTTTSYLDKIVDAGMRLATGDNLFMTKFIYKEPKDKNGDTDTNKKRKDSARIAFGAGTPGTIIPINLDDYNGSIICQKSSFLVGRQGIEISTHFQKTILTGLLGGEGFVMQRLEGKGTLFIHAGGTLKVFELEKDDTLQVDTGCLVAVTSSVTYDVIKAGGFKSVLLAGEGIFFARVQGPGKVWVQSLPFSRLAGRVLYASSKKNIKGEGSPLNIFGELGEKLDKATGNKSTNKDTRRRRR